MRATDPSGASLRLIEEVLGCDLNDFCDRLYAQRPAWVVGSISRYDARFLFKKAVMAGADVAVEIGTASGFSTAILCHALNALSRAGLIGPDFSVVTYDVDTSFYADRQKGVGDAAREVLPGPLLEHVSFRNPATAFNIGESFGLDEIGLLFLDANHRHPWPTLDILAVLDLLAPGATVVLHDIDLPARCNDCPGSGAKLVFDGLDVDKDVPDMEESPNIGGIMIPPDRDSVRDELLAILYGHEWEAKVGEQVTSLALSITDAGLVSASGNGQRAAAEDEIYHDLVDRIRTVVRRTAPPDSTVVVVTKGDRALLDLGGRRGWHFPQRADGVYAGHYPRDSDTAIAHLEALRGKGAEFLVLPSTAAWWLDHYTGFKEHLESRYRLLVRNGSCWMFGLFEPGFRGARAAALSTADPKDRSRPDPEPAHRRAADYVDEPLVEDLMAIFDRDHYEEQTGAGFASADEGLVHYLETGSHGGYDPHPLFDTDYYLQRYPKVRLSGANPLVHFVAHGARDGLDPSPYFDTDYYYAQAPSFRDQGVNPLVHYVKNARLGKARRPNPIFGDGYYLSRYRDAIPDGWTPLGHYLQSGWKAGRFISSIHRNLIEQTARSARSSLLRGNWKNGTVLFFSYGLPSEIGTMIPQVAEALASDHHLDSMVIALGRPVSPETQGNNAKLLVLEDFQTACDVFRPSALRLLAKSFLSMKPLFAVTEVHEVTDVLHAEHVPTYLLLDSPESLPSHVLSDVFENVDRVLLSSSDAFHASAERLGRYPTNVGLQPFRLHDERDDGRGQEAPAGEVNGASINRYARSLLAGATYDFGLEDFSRARAPRTSREPTRTVIIPCPDWAVSGVNASLEAIGRELIDLGWHVEILFTRDRDYVSQSAGDGAHLPAIPHRFLKRDKPGVMGMWEALIADVQTKAPCILFTAYDFLANSAAPALTDDVGVVTWVQADDGDYYEQAYRLGRYCNAVVCVSEWIKDKVAALNPILGERSHVICNSSVWEREVARRKTRSADRLKIVYSGRLVQYQKRVMDYIELASTLDETRIPYTITLIGQFSGREDVLDAFHMLGQAHLADGRIVLPGRMSRSQILQQLSEHDFFVLLSDFEGFPLSVVEAMARGCIPVVAETASGIPEIVDDSVNGLVIGGRDYRKWAELLTDLWSDRARYTRMSQRARRSVKERLTVEQVARQFDELFRSVADEIPAGAFHRPPSLHWGEERSWSGDVLPPPPLHRPVNIAGLQ